MVVSGAGCYFYVFVTSLSVDWGFGSSFWLRAYVELRLKCLAWRFLALGVRFVLKMRASWCYRRALSFGGLVVCITVGTISPGTELCGVLNVFLGAGVLFLFGSFLLILLLSF